MLLGAIYWTGIKHYCFKKVRVGGKEGVCLVVILYKWTLCILSLCVISAIRFFSFPNVSSGNNLNGKSQEQYKEPLHLTSPLMSAFC